MQQDVDKFGAYAISPSLAAIVKLTAHFKRLNSIWKTTKGANRPRRVSDHLTTTYFELTRNGGEGGGSDGQSDRTAEPEASDGEQSSEEDPLNQDGNAESERDGEEDYNIEDETAEDQARTLSPDEFNSALCQMPDPTVSIERRIELGDLLFFKRKAVFATFNISDVLTHGLVEPVPVEARPFT
ncbi:hypothetical protein B0H14DRAFT_3524997 [Mycena olivaceomarginata]|nr:hypothetical protein B0H14DRAFT_3524997 [Mycena olivaceomarginata]